MYNIVQYISKDDVDVEYKLRITRMRLMNFASNLAILEQAIERERETWGGTYGGTRRQVLTNA